MQLRSHNPQVCANSLESADFQAIWLFKVQFVGATVRPRSSMVEQGMLNLGRWFDPSRGRQTLAF